MKEGKTKLLNKAQRNTKKKRITACFLYFVPFQKMKLRQKRRLVKKRERETSATMQWTVRATPPAAAAAHLYRCFPQHLSYLDLGPLSLHQVCCFQPLLDHRSIERRTTKK